MILLLNLILAILAFIFVRYAMLEAKASPVVATVVAALFGLVIFLANIAEQLF